jgi:hypothetical protein
MASILPLTGAFSARFFPMHLEIPKKIKSIEKYLLNFCIFLSPVGVKQALLPHI